MNQESVNPARSLYYGFFSKMLVFTTLSNRYDGILEALDIMIANPIDENSCEALKEIKGFIEAYGYEGLSDEYDAIFYDPEAGAIRDTASYYDEGLESGRKRLEVKNFLGKTKIRRNEKLYKDNEDSVSFLVTFMHELIEFSLHGEKQYDTVQHCLFTEIVNEFFDEFVINLYEHDRARAYRSLAIVLNAFLEFERLYFDVRKPKPKPPKKVLTEILNLGEIKRRAENKAKKEQDKAQATCEIEKPFISMDIEDDI